jgi:hypothetical protein
MTNYRVATENLRKHTKSHMLACSLMINLRSLYLERATDAVSAMQPKFPPLVHHSNVTTTPEEERYIYDSRGNQGKPKPDVFCGSHQRGCDSVLA